VAIGLAICPYYALCLFVYLPIASFVMVRQKSMMIRTVMEKFRMNAMLGGFTEEMLSSLKLIISFGQEQKKLKEYQALAEKTYNSAKKSAIIAGQMQGFFYALMTGFSLFSWGLGLAMIKYEIPNPRFDRLINVGDIVGTYQALMYGMFTVMQVTSLMPAVIRALTVGRQVIDVIDREPLI